MAHKDLVTDPHSALRALEQIRRELDAIPKKELRHQNLDAVSALITVRGVLPRLLTLRPQIQEHLPTFDLTQLDRLELYARALQGAHCRCAALKARNREPAALMAQGIALRRQLVSDLRALVQRGIIAPEQLKGLRGQRGYKQVAADLLLLATLFEGYAPSIAGKCAITRDELARAEELCDSLTSAFAYRGEPDEREGYASDQCERAFTLFFRAYSQVRRAVQYLRFDQGDADTFVPPLCGKRKGWHKHGNTEPENEAGRAPSPFAPSPSSGVEASAPTAELGQRQSSGRIAVGLPDSDPFV